MTRTVTLEMTGDIMAGLARRAREPIGIEQQQQAAQQLAELAAQWVNGAAQGRPVLVYRVPWSAETYSDIWQAIEALPARCG